MVANGNNMQLNITNAEYTQNQNNDRIFKFDVKYSLQSQFVYEDRGDGFGQYPTENYIGQLKDVNVYLQFTTLDGTVTNLVSESKNIGNTDSGTWNFQVVDSVDYTALPDNVMRLQVYVWLAANNAPLSQPAGIQKTLINTNTPVADTRPSTNWVQTSFSTDFKYENFDLSGTIFAERTNNFNTNNLNVPLTLFLQAKNANGVTVLLDQYNFTFGNNQQFSKGINNVFVSNDQNITLELYVMDSSGFPYSVPFTKSFSSVDTTAPIAVPDGFHLMPDGSIMADSEMYNFIVESDGKVRMIRLTGTNQDYEIKVMPDNVESYISRGIARLLTEQERAGVIAPEPEPVQTFCVNVYDIRDSGSVYSTPYAAITAEKVQELQLTKLVVSCEADYLPTEKQVQDFYGFVPPAPEIDTSINSTMVSQSVGAFILKDGRIKGEILYIANQSFNSFYYNKSITSIIQIKSKSGVTIAIKSNNLNFTETQRDETIFIDESAGNFKELTIDFFVWDSPLSMVPFTETKQIQIVDETDIPDPDPFDPQPPATTCPNGFHKDFSGKCVPNDPVGEIPRDKLIDTLKGFLFGTVALSLLARKY